MHIIDFVNITRMVPICKYLTDHGNNQSNDTIISARPNRCISISRMKGGGSYGIQFDHEYRL